jgi:hypothetical protein
MKRTAAISLLVTVAFAQTAAVNQPDRTFYQAAFRAWRAADPDLERDTASGDATLGARADRVAAEAAKYFVARKGYLDALETDTERKAVAVEPSLAPSQFESNPASIAEAQSKMITASINAVANDPDRAIQRLRQALERERTALALLSSALNDTQTGRENVERASAAAEQSRGAVVQHYRTLSANLKQAAIQTQEAGPMWADYYRALSDGARGVPSREVAPPVTSAAPESAPAVSRPAPSVTAAPAVVSSAVPTTAPAVSQPVAPEPTTTVNPTPAPASDPAPASAPAPAPSVASSSASTTPRLPITPVPLSRYVGAWVYPTVGAQYHGPEPESVDMIVREDNGRAKGTLVVRFRVAQGGPIEPVVRFDFEGPFQSTRNQSFPLVTSKGATGNVELLPGNAFNLLEVSFSAEDRPGTIRQGNFLLIKK